MEPVRQVTPLRQRMIEDMTVRNLTEATQRVYLERVAAFARYFGRSPELLSAEDVRTYQVFLTQQKKVAWSTLNQTVCALRFLYRTTLNKEWAIECIPYARKERTLPAVLSSYEVSRLFEATT